jgi:hypothetical protein
VEAITSRINTVSASAAAHDKPGGHPGHRVPASPNELDQARDATARQPSAGMGPEGVAGQNLVPGRQCVFTHGGDQADGDGADGGVGVRRCTEQ